MPTYHYRCADCGHSFDFFQRFSEDPLTTCPECEGTIRRVLQPVGIVFKGSGWYVNDNRKSESSTSSPAASPSSASNGGEKSKSAETKPEAKPEVKAAAATDS